MPVRLSWSPVPAAALGVPQPERSVVNTPQFSWVLSRLPKQAQPVPPIYQPEVAARAVLDAADHPGRREYWVGGSTLGTLAANAIAPGLLDRYLARTGFHSQQTEDARPPDQPANLWAPADGNASQDYGAHGIFDKRSADRSVQQWGSEHHGVFGSAVAAFAAAGGVVSRQLQRWRR